MLAKCANPLCSSLFLHLREGKLFRLEGELIPVEAKKPEYFWLCSLCSETMTLCLDADAFVKTIPLPNFGQRPAETPSFIAARRRKGFLLNCIHARRRTQAA